MPGKFVGETSCEKIPVELCETGTFDLHNLSLIDLSLCISNRSKDWNMEHRSFPSKWLWELKPPPPSTADLGNYPDPVLGTFFVCKQIVFCSYVATWLCYYLWRYCLIFKDPIKSQHRVHGMGTYSYLTTFHLYCFNLIVALLLFLSWFVFLLR